MERKTRQGGIPRVKGCLSSKKAEWVAFMEGMLMRLNSLAGLIVGGLLVAGLTGCSSGTKEQLTAVQQENVELHGKINDLEARATQAEGDKKAYESEIATLKANANNNPPEVVDMGPVGQPKPKPSNPVFHLAGDVAFPSGSVNLTAAAKKELDTLAKKLKGTYAGRNIRVEGHTDSTPIKKSKYGTNEALSQARAEAVRSYLASKGVSSNRIEAIGYGSAKPKATPAASRRVDVVVLAD